MARPSTYTTQLATTICERLLSGRSLRAICREDRDMPSASVIFSWLSKHKEFAEQYARAKETMAEAIFWEIFDIADDGTNDIYTDEKGNVRINHDIVARSRLRVDARKWALARMEPKKYGERITQEIVNPHGDPRNMSDEEKIAKLNIIYQAARKRNVTADKILNNSYVDDGLDLV